MSIGHQAGDWVARVGASVSVNPDLIADSQIMFDLPQSRLWSSLNATSKDLMHGNYWLKFSYQALLLRIHVMLFLSTTAFVHTLTFLHLIAGLKATTNLNKVAIYSECKTNVAREESLHSIFLDQSYQDIVKGLDNLEVLKIFCWFPCFKVDADILEQNVMLQYVLLPYWTGI